MIANSLRRKAAQFIEPGPCDCVLQTFSVALDNEWKINMKVKEGDVPKLSLKSVPGGT